MLWHWCDVNGETSSPYEKRSLFICEETGHLAQDHKKQMEKGEWFAPEDERKGASCPRQGFVSSDGRRWQRGVLCRCWKTGFLIRRSGSTSASPSLDIYSVTTTMIKSNKLSIPIQIEDIEERSVEAHRLRCRWQVYRWKLCQKNGIQDSQIGETLTSLQCGWNWEQMRNNQILCQPQFGNKWKADDYRIIGNWTGERKKHPWIPLVARKKTQISIGRQANSLGENLGNEDF